MISIYHNIVGRGIGVMLELAVSIDRNGLVDPAHAEIIYNQLGDWVRSCCGQVMAHTNGVLDRNNQQLVLRLPQSVTWIAL
jgi:hypothetical protein